MVQDRGLAARGPGTTEDELLGDPGFLLEDEPGTPPAGAFRLRPSPSFPLLDGGLVAIPRQLDRV